MCISCEHPLHINGYTIPCGKCNSRLLARGSHYSLMCEREESQSKYCYFITLTYSNSFLPTVRAVLSSDGTKYSFYADNPMDDDFGRKLFDFEFSKDFTKDDCDRLMWKKSRLWSAHLGYLKYRDIQLFMKRLRKNLSVYGKEEIRYFVAGEYGPQSFRPHWHILLYFDSPAIQSNILKALSSCWQCGIVDCSQFQRKVSSYVASYVNCVGSMPVLYKNDVMRTKMHHSSYFGCKDYIEDKETIYSLGYSYFDGLRDTVLSKSVEIHPWRSLLSNLFPRCSGYDRKTCTARYFTYTILRTAEDLYHKMRIAKLSRMIFEDITNGIDNMVTIYFRTFFGRKWHYVDGQYVYETDAEYYSRLFGCIQRDLYVSNKFLKMCCDGLWFNSHRAFDMVEKFYKDRDYKQLVEMYSSQVIDASNGDLPFTFSTYYDNKEIPLDYVRFDVVPFETTWLYRNHCAASAFRVVQGLKRKTHNDLVGCFCDMSN